MIVEIAQLKLVKGTDPKAFVRATEATHPFLQKQPGYVDRELLKLTDDQWVDLVHWKTLDEAKAAGKALMRDPSCRDFVKMLDPQGTKVLYHELVEVWKP